MTFQEDLQDLIRCYNDSPFPSFKVTSYFPAYAQLFRHLRNAKCTFIETGVLNGGSLFMWRSWLGEQARIIGCDLNPEAGRWRDSGFEIFVGDQGDPNFWRGAFAEIGRFDAFLDDGGHQSFQQIVTLQEAIRAATDGAVIVVEDTCTSMMKEFAAHRDRSFLEYAKASTDVLTARMAHFFPGEFPKSINRPVLDAFAKIASIQFYAGMVAYRIDGAVGIQPELVWNKNAEQNATDFRYKGVSSAEIDWPSPYVATRVTVKGR